jgi:hypothetical protein
MLRHTPLGSSTRSSGYLLSRSLITLDAVLSGRQNTLVGKLVIHGCPGVMATDRGIAAVDRTVSGVMLIPVSVATMKEGWCGGIGRRLDGYELCDVIRVR